MPQDHNRFIQRSDLNPLARPLHPTHLQTSTVFIEHHGGAYRIMPQPQGQQPATVDSGLLTPRIVFLLQDMKELLDQLRYMGMNIEQRTQMESCLTRYNELREDIRRAR